MQTPVARYSPRFRENMIKVILEVNSHKARYFKTNKFFPSQETLEELDNGNLRLCYTVTRELEVIDFIKQWIPHIKIIEPLSLKEKIEKQLAEYLGL